MLRAAARTGFVAEGVLHGYVRTRNRRGDVTILSLLPTDLAVV
jgi:hypothetical protein